MNRLFIALAVMAAIVYFFADTFATLGGLK
jgi:hypothetical protein